MGLAGLLLPFIHCQLSVVVNFSFPYNTLFLSSLGFMAAQYKPSIHLLVSSSFKDNVPRSGYITAITARDQSMVESGVIEKKHCQFSFS